MRVLLAACLCLFACRRQVTKPEPTVSAAPSVAAAPAGSLPRKMNSSDATPRDEPLKRCGPRPDGTHCVLLTLRTEDARSIERLKAVAKVDGVDIDHSMGGWTMVLSDQRLQQVFGAKVEYDTVALNSTHGYGCEANLAGIRLPGRYARYVEALSIGHQICE